MLQVIDDDGVTDWAPVEHFAEADPDEKCFHIDSFAGEVQFGPAVRQGDGTLRQYGAVPPKGAHLRLSVYRTGGGVRGNIATGQVRVLKTSVPYVARVENRTPAVGGARAEDIEDAKLRGPLVLRSRGRAVTAEDYVELTKQVAPEIARVHCLGVDGGGVRVLVVPFVATDDVGRIRRDDLVPLPESLSRIAGYLDERRLVGTRLVIEPPEYQGVTAVISVRARPRYRPEDVRKEVLTAVYRLFDPLHGGPEGAGWPLGRAVQAHEVNAALARIPGVDMAEEVNVQLFPADASDGPARVVGAANPVGAHRVGVLLRAPGPGAVMRGSGASSAGGPTMRGLVPGLAQPVPDRRDVAVGVPGRSFTQRWCSALDEVLAPIITTLDSLPAYLDPATAPEDLLPLAGRMDGHRAGRPPERRAAAGTRADRGRAAAVAGHRSRRAGGRPGAVRYRTGAARVGRHRALRSARQPAARHRPAGTAGAAAGSELRGVRRAPAGRAGRDGQAGPRAAPGGGHRRLSEACRANNRR